MDHKNDPQPTQWTKLMLLISVTATLSTSLPIGYTIGVINAPAVHVKAWCNSTLIETYDWHLDNAAMEILWSSIVSVLLVGGAVGSFSGAWIADRLGRKGALLICGALYLSSAILFFFCRMAGSVEMLLIARIVVGLASGLTTSTVPMYLTELAPIKVRGTLGVLTPMGLVGGIVVGQVASLQQVFGTEDLWHVAFSAYGLIVLVCLLPFPWFPESPKFLYIVQKNENKAKLQLMSLRNNQTKMVEDELAILYQESLTQTDKRSIMSVLRDRTLTLPLILVGSLCLGQQLSGINAVFYYSVSIFQNTGLSYENAQWANLGIGCVALCAVAFNPLIMEYINRRTVILWSCFVSGMFLVILTVIVHFVEQASWLPIACVVAVICFIIAFECGLGPIPHFIASELFEVGPRPAAMSIGSASFWTGNFIVAMAFPSLQQIWGAFVFLPFAIICFVLFTLLRFYLPETRGQQSSIVAALMRDGFKSKPLIAQT